MTDKHALRAALRARRRIFAASGPMPPAPPALFLDALRPGVIVASYVPIGGEADPARFDRAARAAGASLAWPVVIDRESPISFHVDDRMHDGPFGLRQPGADSPPVAPDIILTPLVGFDAAGNRLGQGAGHYDRAFARWPDSLRIGIAWSMQQVDALPCDPWDVPLHAIVTETALFLTGELP
ncbi:MULTISPECIES: 5-formyltetrahydrofolate cyclo-ligase [unclassified Sphingomonas]|uniref:5-formyltetrahydrofolate cyclo-ligase n=1 Tax=unclassified Sphingomonas TaxID=196159 RepID=UPI0006FD1EC8|nr:MULTISPECIES: 5-formyltetrahydrofolate cyclo-ligase [unclassified Sphingomonas]KQM66771.1 5-formyltetrahydrofolate cyclo-ligase [Sphingomonas sp. Leaf16]KQN17719.1 5-formyltetrahydrofolate cyclo-ligase [Sphingomonas sp. Leaf29]KQN23581.1 5-formyltetrahydrofolate cyclo-ligase [Sphingomonas sp. Leaf32]